MTMAKNKEKKKKTSKANSTKHTSHKLKGEQLDFVLKNIAELKKDMEVVEIFKESFPKKSITYQLVNYYRHLPKYQEEIKARREIWRNSYLDNIPLANKTKRLEELSKLYNGYTHNGNSDVMKALGADGTAVVLKILAQIHKETECILGKKGLDGNPSDLPGGLSAELTATIPLGSVESDKLRGVIKLLQDGASKEGKS